MATVFAGLMASIGLALVITALTLPKRQTPQVIDSFTKGIARMETASLGFQ